MLRRIIISSIYNEIYVIIIIDDIGLIWVISPLHTRHNIMTWVTSQ